MKLKHVYRVTSIYGVFSTVGEFKHTKADGEKMSVFEHGAREFIKKYAGGGFEQTGENSGYILESVENGAGRIYYIKVD